MARKWPYSAAAWPKVRRLILLRDGAVCKVLLPGCTGTATDVDHIISVSDGGAPFDPKNLRAACRHCNATLANQKRGRRKTLPSAKEW